jgi:hypothetical protein
MKKAIDWRNQTIAYARQKTGTLAMIHFGPSARSSSRGLIRMLVRD